MITSKRLIESKNGILLTLPIFQTFYAYLVLTARKHSRETLELMKHWISILLFIFAAKYATAGIQIKSSVVIEQGAFDAKQIEFWIENSDYKFSFSKLQREIHNGRFVNTNICGYIERFSGKGTHTFVIRLTSEDSVFTFEQPFYIEANTSSIKNEILIGHKGNEKSYLKGFTMNKFISNSNEFFIEALNDPKIGESPLFLIQNNTQDTLQPKTCLINESQCSNNYYGILYHQGSDSQYRQASPYKFCSDKPEKIVLLPNDKTTVYISNGTSCDLFSIEEIGKYYILMYLIKEEDLRKNNEAPFFKSFTKYKIKYEFEVTQ